MMAAERGLVELGGCVVDEATPTRRCLDCGQAWTPSDETPSAGYNLDSIPQEIKGIIYRNLYPIFTGIASATLFSEHHDNFQPVRDYLRLKQILGITSGCSIEQVHAVQLFQKLHPDEYRQIIEELTRQVCVLTRTNRWHGGHYNILFTAAALVFNASPMSHGRYDSDSLKHFYNTVRRGQIGFE